MTIRLRSHHLLCTLTFAGKGYTQAFIDNYESIARRIAAGGESVEVVEGPDDICAPLADEPGCHCFNESVRQRDRKANEALSGLLQLPINSGTQMLLTPERLQAMRVAFAAGLIREACSDCQWKSLCDSIAEDGFQQSRLVCLEHSTEQSSPSKRTPLTP